MSFRGLHHVVLNVEDVPDAEEFYQELFDLEVLFREGTQGETFGRVPDGVDWIEATRADIDPAMSFLSRDQFALAVAETDEQISQGHLNHIALAVDEADIETIQENARQLSCGTRNSSHSLFIGDQYGIEWELNTSSPPPRSPLDILAIK